MINKTDLVSAILAAGYLTLLSGCDQSSPGARIMQREKCFECHTISGKGGAVGPNLTTVGSRRSRDYIVEQIKNPSAHRTDSAMPSFKHLPDQDIQAIADYLSRLN